MADEVRAMEELVAAFESTPISALPPLRRQAEV
jgi:hypothetical protein